VESEFALSIHQLSVNYEKKAALWDIDLKVPQGKLVAVIGPNGAGKSTLIKAILQLVPSVSGSVTLLGKPLNEVRKKIAYVPQRESVDWDFPITVRELVLMGRFQQIGLFSRAKAADHEAVERTLQVMNLTHLADRQIKELSGGQQQRAFLARALIQEALIYFLDEPFTGVDAKTEQDLLTLFKELKNLGKTLFVVHHDLHAVKKTFDFVILLNLRLIASGPTEVVFNERLLEEAYGAPSHIFGEALKLARRTVSGGES
jgi:manganese/zinc/iron transport system ATP- binding protein